MSHLAPTMLPPTKALRDSLLNLLGRDVQVVPSSPWSPGPMDPGAVAVYVDNGMRLRALVSCDLPLAVTLGASIALIPAKTAANCVKNGGLTAEMTDNLHKVLTVVGALFNRPERPHVKLYQIHAPGAVPPQDLSVQLRTFGNRLDLKVHVSGYGGGLLSCVVM